MKERSEGMGKEVILEESGQKFILQHLLLTLQMFWSGFGRLGLFTCHCTISSLVICRVSCSIGFLTVK